MLALLLMPISVRDISDRSLLRMQLTHAANSAVLAGAAYLPGQPEKASQVAKNCAALNGVVSSELVSIETAQDGHSISMIVQRSATAAGFELGQHKGDSFRAGSFGPQQTQRRTQSCELPHGHATRRIIHRLNINLVATLLRCALNRGP